MRREPQSVTLAQASELLGIPLRRLYRWSSRRGSRPPTIHPIGVLADRKTRVYELEDIERVAARTRRGRPTAPVR